MPVVYLFRLTLAIGLVGFGACGADDADDQEDVRVTLSGLRWEIPCTGPAGVSFACSCTDATEFSANLSGAAGTVYDVRIRFQGAIETKTYTAAAVTDGFWRLDAMPGDDTYNVYGLQISDPRATYALNGGSSFVHHTHLVDYERTVPIAADATVTLFAQTIDNEQIRNVGEDGAPVVPDGVPPAPNAYDGQFIQMDVLEVTPRPDE